jgi:uncharacterized protein (DUF1697 family)
MSQTARYIAFLRAINVGGHVVKMDRLRKLFEGEGFTNIETFIASGNVVFDGAGRPGKIDALERAIEGMLKAALGHDVATFVRPAELRALAAHDAFSPAASRSATAFTVAFLAGRSMRKGRRR